MILRERWFLLFGGVAGALAVALGAFGAHALKARLSERAFEVFEVAVRYQMYHALALLGVGLLLYMLAMRSEAGVSGAGATHRPPPQRLLSTAGVLFLLGILLFCGSLYLYTLADVKFVVRITPIGGVAWLAAWICLAVAGWRVTASGAGE